MRVGSDWSTSLWMNARSPGEAHDSDDDGQQPARNDCGDGEVDMGVGVGACNVRCSIYFFYPRRTWDRRRKSSNKKIQSF